MKTHHYTINLNWTGNKGQGTKNYRAYKRDYEISSSKKSHPISGSSDPSFLGDPKRYNPEELLVAGISSCHMLWYLHLCATNNIVVTDYKDTAKGIMEELENGSGHFSKVTLYPVITVKKNTDLKLAHLLHEKANSLCFIANSCNFTIEHQPEFILED